MELLLNWSHSISECVVIRDPEFFYMLIEKISLVPKRKQKRNKPVVNHKTQERVLPFW